MAVAPAPAVSLAADRRLPARQRVLLALLAFLGGFTDTAGFLVLFGLFTAHVTGNIVIAAADIVHNGGSGALAKLLMIPLFIFAVAVSTLVIDFVRARWLHRVLTVMVAVEACLLAGFFVLALALDPGRGSPDGSAVIIVGALGVLAMGVQNTMMRELPLVTTLPTTMMTGNTAQMTIAAVRWLRSAGNGDAAVRARSAAHLRVYVPTLCAFLLGAATAAVGVVSLGYWSFAIPVAVAFATVLFTLALDLGPARPDQAAGPGVLHPEPGVRS